MRQDHADEPKIRSKYPCSGHPVATVSHEQHKVRCGLVRAHFSRKAIINIEPLVQEKLGKLSRRLECAYHDTTVVNMSDAFAALTADIIAEYALGVQLDFLDDPSFKNDFQQASVGLDRLCHILKFFPWLATFSHHVPDRVIRYMQPKADSLLFVQKTIQDQSVSSLRKASQLPLDSAQRGNILDSLSHPSVPLCERTLGRLQDEGLIILAAGTETTARALAICTFYLATDKLIM